MKKKIITFLLLMTFVPSIVANEILLNHKNEESPTPIEESTELRAYVNNGVLTLSSSENFIFVVTIKSQNIPLYSIGNVSIDVSSYPSGTYFEIITSHGTYTGNL